jgi:hypothetical protein
MIKYLHAAEAGKRSFLYRDELWFSYPCFKETQIKKKITLSRTERNLKKCNNQRWGLNYMEG